MSEQAQKAMYRVIRKIKFDLPADCLFDSFHKIVVPVLIYGCGIGASRTDVIICVHL